MMLRRRETLVLTTAVACAVLFGGVTFWQATHPDERPWLDTPAVLDAPSALAALRAGNLRFVTSSRTLSIDTAHDAEHRHQIAPEQHPFAAVLCCSDSRLCPEFIFDQRAGNIFEIRNAGNVVDEDVLASFEYAVEHCHVPIILVMAHEGCGAIQAVCQAGEKPLHDHLQELQKHMKGIHPQVIANHDKQTPELLSRLCRENARQQALSLIRDSRIVKTAVDNGEARLLCGIYDMETGAVEFFDLQ